MSILKNTVLAGIGIIQITKDKAEEVIDDLIKRGEIDKSDRKKAVMELVEKAEAQTQSLRDKISTESGKVTDQVTKVVKDLRLATGNDLERLEKKIDKLAKSVAALEKKLGA